MDITTELSFFLKFGAVISNEAQAITFVFFIIIVKVIELSIRYRDTCFPFRAAARFLQCPLSYKTINFNYMAINILKTT